MAGKLKEDLMVEIPKRFKKYLSKKINIKNIICTLDSSGDKWCGLGGMLSCILCKDYRIGLNCGDCPFRRMINRGGSVGCLFWIKELTDEQTVDCVVGYFSEKRSDLIKRIRALRKIAKEYIKWV